MVSDRLPPVVALIHPYGAPTAVDRACQLEEARRWARWLEGVLGVAVECSWIALVSEANRNAARERRAAAARRAHVTGSRAAMLVGGPPSAEDMALARLAPRLIDWSRYTEIPLRTEWPTLLVELEQALGWERGADGV